MRISGLEKMSLVDYDGKVCATVFTSGCNFRCPFCHNSALVISNDFPVIEEDEILLYLQKRKGILDGVCVSGGEPTLNSDLIKFIEKIKNLGYAVKLDTNGTNPEVVKTLVRDNLCDYFAMDIKSDRESYNKIIGLDSYDTKKVEQTVEFFLSRNADYEFRTTLVKEFHDTENIIRIGEWIKGANKYFLQKFKDSESCIQSHLSPVDEKTVLDFLNILKKNIPNTFTRGYDF